MSFYQVHGTLIQSEWALDALTTAEGSPDFSLTLQPNPVPGTSWDLYQTWRQEDDKPWLSYGRSCDDYLIRFHELADFYWNCKSPQIFIHPLATLASETLNHLFLDCVLPLVISRSGKLVLHASAVANAQGALVFLGNSGSGKSTLAASFFKTRDHDLLSDDGLHVEDRPHGFHAYPGSPSLRLWPEMASACFPNEDPFPTMAEYSLKERIPIFSKPYAGGFCTRSIPFRSLYILSPGRSEISIFPLSPQKAFMALLRHSFRLEFSDPSYLQEEFNRLSRLSQFPRLFGLSFPHDLSLLPELQGAILRHQELLLDSR
jgi:hypothetical protein